jgi:dTMP kinase
MERGKFIVLEGINGCGKNSQIHLLSRFLYDFNIAEAIAITKEPNELDEYGKKARQMLASDGDPYKNARQAVEFFAKNRGTHNRLINYLIENGVHVVSNRYWHSNFAFQHAQGISYEDIASANKGLIVPDLTIILDIPVNVAFERLDGRDGDKRRKFDSLVEFMEKVRRNYLELSTILPRLIGDESISIIDGTPSVDKVGRKIIEQYQRRFE